MREEEKKRSSQLNSFRAFLKKRWAYPAIYLASAAIIVTAILWYQSLGNDGSDEPQDFGSAENGAVGQKYDDPAIPVNSLDELFQVPVSNPEGVVIEKEFYDSEASEEEQEAAILVYNNTYYENEGIDYSMEGDEFDVLAALSGTVSSIEEDSLLGNSIEVEHEDGVVTRYQSVKDPAVSVGDEVKQGDILAKAGQSQLNEEAGTHVHFEIRKNNVAVNPKEYINKPLSAIKEQPSNDGDEVDQRLNPPKLEEIEQEQRESNSNTGDSSDSTDSSEDTDGSDEGNNDEADSSGE
ncbi:M23 family metallopeptidase [Bacillus spongiae]|uniref:M23 family metallopeptidase n=1 Tax=Bacillus spongiae TaxID=2683610 RepID=A0ABU8HJ52_9BACI